MILNQLRQRRYVLPGAIALLLIATSLWRNAAKDASTAIKSQVPVPQTLEPLVPPLEQDPYIQVFFNQSEASLYTDPYRRIARHGDNLEAVILDAIEQADSSIDVAVQALNLPLVAQALIARHQQGLKVRLILENQYAQPWSKAAANPDAAQIDRDLLADWSHLADANQDGQLLPTELAKVDAILALQTAGVPWIDDTADGSKGSGLMHHKFLVVDRRWVVMGSANFTLSGIHGDAANPSSRGNANGLLRIDSPSLAQQMTEEFDLMWGDGPGLRADSQFGLSKPARPVYESRLPSDNSSGSQIMLQFSPVSATRPWQSSVNGLIARTLAASKQRIDLALFVFSEQKLANQLEIQSAQGTELRVLVDPGFIYRSYSEALDLLGKSLPDQRCQIEADNRPWSNAIASVGSPHLPPGDKLHHKFAVIDGATVIAGSQNWSYAANTKNDETLLVIHNPVVGAHFSREFERLYKTARLDNRPSLQRKLDASAQRCPN